MSIKMWREKRKESQNSILFPLYCRVKPAIIHTQNIIVTLLPMIFHLFSIYILAYIIGTENYTQIIMRMNEICAHREHKQSAIYI